MVSGAKPPGSVGTAARGAGQYDGPIAYDGYVEPAARGAGEIGGGSGDVVQTGDTGEKEWWSSAVAQSVGKVVLHGGGRSVFACNPFAMHHSASLLFQSAEFLRQSVESAVGARIELAKQAELPLAELATALASLETVVWQAALASEEIHELAAVTYQAAALMAEVELSAGGIFGLPTLSGCELGGKAGIKWLLPDRGKGTWYRGSVSQPILHSISTVTDSVILYGSVVPRLLLDNGIGAQIRRWVDEVAARQSGGQAGLLLRDPAADLWGRDRSLLELLESVGTGALTAGVLSGIYAFPKAIGGMEPHVRVLSADAEKADGTFFPLVLAEGGYRMDRSRPVVPWRGQGAGAGAGRGAAVWGQVSTGQPEIQYGGQPWERPGGQQPRQQVKQESRQQGRSRQPGDGHKRAQQGPGQEHGQTLITGVPIDAQYGGVGESALPTPGPGRVVELPRTLQEHVKVLEELPRREGSMLVGVLETQRGVTVYINGTNSFSPVSASPTSMGSNLDLAAGRRSDSERTVIAALEYAGVQPGTSVTLVGHSQGGMVAAAIASDPLLQSKYGVDNVITFASPLGYSKVAPEVNVIAVENVDDFVPTLDGRMNKNLPNVVTATVDTRHVDRGFVHSLPEVEEAAKLVDAYPDADLQARIRKVHASMASGQGPEVPALTGRMTVLEGRLLPPLSHVSPR